MRKHIEKKMSFEEFEQKVSDLIDQKIMVEKEKNLKYLGGTCEIFKNSSKKRITINSVLFFQEKDTTTYFEKKWNYDFRMSVLDENGKKELESIFAKENGIIQYDIIPPIER